MATQLKLAVLLFIGVAGRAGHASPANATLRQGQAIDSYELVSNPCSNIRQAGFVCVDCGTLGYCVHVDNQWQTIEMTSCKTDGGFYCSDEDAIGCAWGRQCTVPVRGKFYCQLPGKYPDPYDCRSYHECSELNTDTPRRCQNGYAYSTLSESCTMSTTSNTCTEKQYECSYVGQMGAWKSDTSFYYVCQRERQGDVDIYYPLMMKCRSGFVFDGRVCVPEQSVKLLAVNEERVEEEVESLEADEDDNQLSVAFADSVEAVDACTSTYELKANAADCTGYLACQQGVWVSYTCPEGTHFDTSFSVCRHGSCSSTNTDSGDNSGITSTKCRRIGMTADLTDCQKFYYCSEVNGALEHKACPTGTIYDPSAYACVAGSC